MKKTKRKNSQAGSIKGEEGEGRSGWGENENECEKKIFFFGGEIIIIIVT